MPLPTEPTEPTEPAALTTFAISQGCSRCRNHVACARAEFREHADISGAKSAEVANDANGAVVVIDVHVIRIWKYDPGDERNSVPGVVAFACVPHVAPHMCVAYHA